MILCTMLYEYVQSQTIDVIEKSPGQDTSLCMTPQDL